MPCVTGHGPSFRGPPSRFDGSFEIVNFDQADPGSAVGASCDGSVGANRQVDDKSSDESVLIRTHEAAGGKVGRLWPDHREGSAFEMPKRKLKM